jgi:Arc/MetJ family transcription regulator
MSRMIRWRLDPGQIEVVDDAVAEVLRHKTPAEKLALVFAANRTMRLRIEGALRSWHPDWSDELIHREVARRMTRGTT